jgi:hypothetical protein
MRKKIVLFLVVFCVAFGAMFAYYKVPAFQEGLAQLTEQDFSEDNIYSDLDSISARLDEEILKGSDSFTIYLKDMDISEINDINASLDGIFGGGESYQQTGKIGNTYKKVTITVRKSANYYAYAAYAKGEEIPESETKAQELYEVMKQILDTQITSDMTDFEKELALHDYLVTHCVYSDEAEQEAESDIYRAYGALVNQDAVCNGYAEAMQILLMCAGVNTKFVVGTAGGVDHAWNLVELDGKWYHLDSTWDDPKPDQGDNTLHVYFNVTDEIMEQSHVWEEDNYPKANDMTYNYYVKNGIYFRDFLTYKDRAYTEMVTNGDSRFEAAVEDYVVKDSDMQFIFEDNYRYNSVSWQTFEEGSYHVLVLKGE